MASDISDAHEPHLPPAIRGGWREETLQLCGRTLRLRLPAQPDAYLESVLEDGYVESTTLDPYWAMLWPAARLTAERVLSVDWPAGLPALEIGAGIGLVGLAGLAAGLDVTFSDHAPPAVALCRENAALNGFPEAKSMLLDWREPPARQFPLILGSDVVYDRSSHPLLWQLFRRTLTADGVVWLGDQGRFHTEEFVREAPSHGFRAELWDEHGMPLPKPALNQFRLIAIRRVSPVA